MKGSKLHYHLQALSPEEQEDFRRYLNSELFCRNQMLSRVLDLMLAEVLHSEEDISRPAFFALLYPDKPYSDTRLKNLLWECLHQLQQFLSLQAFRQAPALQRRLLVHEMLDRDLDQYFPKLWERAAQQNQQQPHSATAYRERYHLHLSRHRYLNSAARRRGNPELGALHQALDQAFMLEKLHFACVALNQERITGMHTEIHLLDPVLDLIQADPEQQSLPIRLYYQVYRTLTQPEDETAFRQLYELIIHPQEQEAIDAELVQEIYTYARNYCARKLNAGTQDYAPIAMELYRFGLENGVLLDDNDQLVFDFKNMVALGTRTGHHAWVEDLVDRYLDRLPEALRRPSRNYNTGLLRFYQKRYQEAARLLQEILRERHDIFYSLDGRVYLCRTWYHLEEYDLLDVECERFRTYLRNRGEISAAHTKRYRELIRLFARLSRIVRDDPDKRPARLQALRETAQTKLAVHRGKWLLQEIDRAIKQHTRKAK